MTVDQRTTAKAIMPPVEMPPVQPGRKCGGEESTGNLDSVQPIGKSDHGDHAMDLLQLQRPSSGGPSSTISRSLIHRVQRRQGRHLQRVQRRAA
ncbi:Os05g0346200 [Oryza sativa Japonica Group]|uniref:Isoform 3 of Dehydration-responsive element-binding protein 2B n=1 Tax=Oryza sativa subsp. japonica TaxID=39947 RepID=Q5W6R4-3|nr:hypothetical protein EE612_028810 [Oryza sativa]BAS93499.1 Os05g0346200 [Oryza sativa Japonica Group]